MAQKHKSKYKTPKDFEKSQKPKTRKDLKDYMLDDKDEKLNPKSTKEKQTNVLRKTDKEVVDTGKFDVKYNADDRLYTDLEDGEYDPKHAAKVFKKRQDKDETDNAKNIKDKVENLTREQKERLVREYVRRKIERILMEAEGEETPTEEAPEEAPAPSDTTATPAPDVTTTPTPTDIPIDPTTSATTPTATPEAPAPTPTEEPTETQPAATEPTPQELENRSLSAAATELSKEGAVGKIDMLSKMLNQSMQETDPEDKAMFYRLLRSYSIKKLAKLRSAQS